MGRERGQDCRTMSLLKRTLVGNLKPLRSSVATEVEGRDWPLPEVMPREGSTAGLLTGLYFLFKFSSFWSTRVDSVNWIRRARKAVLVFFKSCESTCIVTMVMRVG